MGDMGNASNFNTLYSIRQSTFTIAPETPILMGFLGNCTPDLAHVHLHNYAVFTEFAVQGDRTSRW